MATEKRVPQVNDDRLCWLAVREELGKKSRKPGLVGVFSLLGGARGGHGGTRLGGDMRREGSSDRMGDYALAVDAASGTLSAEERKHLRATGEVPEWFLAEVERRATVIKKQR
ncbi:hypothetical protein GXW82_25810 [Streptacidiphilus sp. 4-A2]|nr:hypothetical protein [Streptacidiphilus sp. 4-A2]